jgi:hypothetical protein
MVRTMSSAGNAPLPADPTLWAEMPLAVAGRDIPEVPVTLRAGARVSGMVQLNGSAERPTGDQFGMVGIQLEPADVRPGVNNTRGRIDQTGQIQTMGVPPGKYFIRVLGSYPNWSLQSFTVNGRDATVVPIDIGANDVSGAVLTFTDRPTKLVGQVTLETGLSGVAVLVFPVDQSAWIGYGSSTRRMANTRADKDGRFEVSNLPAGDYFAIAIPDKSANDWQNPKFLESLVPDAARIRIQDAGTATVTLKVVK